MVKIGVTSQVARGEAVHAALQSYIDRVRAAGGEPVLLEWEPRRAAELLASVDGVVMTGGPDVDPAYYGIHPPHASVVCAPPLRDNFEVELARLGLESGVPMLGICRGLQVMNVALGGTLVQDIAAVLPTASEHQQQYPQNGAAARPRGERTHTVEIEPASLLAKALGSRERLLEVNSMHHQAVGRVSSELAVVARAVERDPRVEIVEGLEARQGRHPFYLAVQWHPEELANPDVGGDPAAEDARCLFAALVAAAHRRGASRS
ncbi:gamma-glutamyl-gamma-aminobutyrate hydrolase family protein [bacterium]|nr:MAG: gamma-glutamyl-gamma-aminobutyrate hydrolase family protein [bacterium]